MTSSRANTTFEFFQIEEKKNQSKQDAKHETSNLPNAYEEKNNEMERILEDPICSPDTIDARIVTKIKKNLKRSSACIESNKKKKKEKKRKKLTITDNKFSLLKNLSGYNPKEYTSDQFFVLFFREQQKIKEAEERKQQKIKETEVEQQTIKRIEVAMHVQEMLDFLE